MPASDSIYITGRADDLLLGFRKGTIKLSVLLWISFGVQTRVESDVSFSYSPPNLKEVTSSWHFLGRRFSDSMVYHQDSVAAAKMTSHMAVELHLYLMQDYCDRLDSSPRMG